jgi:hypothetical protein
VTFDPFRPPLNTLIVPQNERGGLTLSDMLVIDAVTSEAWSDDALPTRLPVEDGADVTDHVVTQPTRLSLGVVQSNHPVTLVGLGEVVANANIGGVVAITGTSPMRARQFYEDLFRFQQTKQLLTVITPHRVGENMILTSLPPTWDATNGEGFVATLQFEEIIRVSTRIVEVSRSGSPKTNLGGRTGKAATPAEEENASFIFKATR